MRRKVEEIFNDILDTENIILTRVDRARLFEAVAAEILGFGPIEPLLKDNSINEIMVNGPKHGLHRAPRSPGEDQRVTSRTTST